MNGTQSDEWNALPPLHRTSIPNRRGIARRGLLQLLALDHKAWVLAEHVIDHSNERGEGLLHASEALDSASAPNLHCQLAAGHLEERRGRLPPCCFLRRASRSNTRGASTRLAATRPVRWRCRRIVR